MDNITGTPAVPVVSGTAILTDESYSTLKSMLSSNDEADWKMAQLILNQLHVQSNIVRIRELGKAYCNRMVNLRTKASRKFRDETNLFYISYTNNYEFVKWLDGKGWLTTEIFQSLKPQIITQLKARDNHKFYKLSFEVKDEYKHLDPEQTLEPLTINKDE
jgi:hypothetical protein